MGGGRTRGRKGAGAPQSVEDLKARLAEVQDEERAAFDEERAIREELKAVEALWIQAHRRENLARDAVEDAVTKTGRAWEYMTGDLKSLTEKVVKAEQEDQARQHHESAWQAELDSCIVSQAKSMEIRDKLVAETSALEAQALKDSSRAAEAEAQSRKLEDKIAKDRQIVELLKREIAAR
eukprot:TRINITY_DN43922_c0_g1_i1.p1 TRINITY_DN43922_c0_g1~~TRINITY_DN43922_c0_g1_i1.p1  ORF type:complete len:180 (+),score=65.42 TRINITY_DN43922_c0_g1_i1:65-604(+)